MYERDIEEAERMLDEIREGYEKKRKLNDSPACWNGDHGMCGFPACECKCHVSIERGAPGCTCGTPPFAPPSPADDCPFHGPAATPRTQVKSEED